MATLEKIIYNQDTGTEAIQKLDRNQRKINDAVEIIDMDGVNRQITSLTSRDVAQQQQINTLSDKLSNLDGVPQQINTINSKLSNLDGVSKQQIDALSSKLSNLDGIPQQVTDINTKLSSFDGIPQQVTTLSQSVSTLEQNVKKAVTDLTTIGGEILLQKTIPMSANSTAYIKLPERYIGILTVYSHVKGEYQESYFVQVVNKYAYHIEKLCESRFNHSASEIYSEFANSDDTAHVLLCIHNNTALSDDFYVTLTQNLRGDR